MDFEYKFYKVPPRKRDFKNSMKIIFFYLCNWFEPLRFTSNEKTIQWILKLHENNYSFSYLCKWFEPFRFTSNEKTIWWICARTVFEMTDLLTLYADHAVFTVRLVFDSSLKNSGGVKRIREVVPAWGRNQQLSLLPVLWTSCSNRQSELWKLIHEELVFPRLHSHWLNNPSGTGVQVYLSRYFVLK